jgi:hypothetical protein
VFDGGYAREAVSARQTAVREIERNDATLRRDAEGAEAGVEAVLNPRYSLIFEIFCMRALNLLYARTEAEKSHYVHTFRV